MRPASATGGPSAIRGGPGTNDPTRWICPGHDLHDLLVFAFRARPYELSAPPWTSSVRFDIEAKLAAGSTLDDLREMVQNLLIERFKLQFHREERETPIYELTIAKNGPKLALAQGVRPPRPPVPPSLGQNGFPVIPPGQAGQAVINGRAAWRAVGESTEHLAAYVSGFVGRPVQNATGLEGKYDFLLYWVNPGAPDPDGPTIFEALADQLGLKLVARRGTVPVVVVDALSKTPGEN